MVFAGRPCRTVLMKALEAFFHSEVHNAGREEALENVCVRRKLWWVLPEWKLLSARCGAPETTTTTTTTQRTGSIFKKKTPRNSSFSYPASKKTLGQNNCALLETRGPAPRFFQIQPVLDPNHRSTCTIDPTWTLCLPLV